MQILLISPFYPPFHSGGYELRCHDIMRVLEKRGHIIRVISNLLPTEEFSESQESNEIFRVLHLKSQTHSVFRQVINDLKDMHFIRRQIRDFKPDLVYLSHMGDLSNAIIPYLSCQNLPFLYDEGGTGLMRTFHILKRGLYFYDNNKDSRLKVQGKKIFTNLIGRFSFGFLKTNTTWPDKMHILVNSHATMDYAKAHGVPARNFRVIHSGIDLHRFPMTDRKGLNNNLKILVPGRIVPIKGTIDAVYLLKELLDHKISVELLIVGKVVDDVYYEELQLLITKLDVAQSVEFISMIDQENLAQLYQQSDFCFFPSRQIYGLSRVPLEAMASGALVISYGGESSGEVIQHYQTGLLVEAGNITEAANWIVKLVQSQGQYLEIVKKARREVEEKYSLESYVDRVESYLNFIREGQQ